MKRAHTMSIREASRKLSDELDELFPVVVGVSYDLREDPHVDRPIIVSLNDEFNGKQLPRLPAEYDNYRVHYQWTGIPEFA